jgi:hypothetical protein
MSAVTRLLSDGYYCRVRARTRTRRDPTGDVRDQKIPEVLLHSQSHTNIRERQTELRYAIRLLLVTLKNHQEWTTSVSYTA